MTVSERKLSILSQINQQAVSSLVEELAALSVKHDEVVAERDALKTKLDAITKPADRADPMSV